MKGAGSPPKPNLASLSQQSHGYDRVGFSPALTSRLYPSNGMAVPTHHELSDYDRVGMLLSYLQNFTDV